MSHPFFSRSPAKRGNEVQAGDNNDSGGTKPCPGKRREGGAKRDHILLDDNPIIGRRAKWEFIVKKLLMLV